MTSQLGVVEETGVPSDNHRLTTRHYMNLNSIKEMFTT